MSHIIKFRMHYSLGKGRSRYRSTLPFTLLFFTPLFGFGRDVPPAAGVVPGASLNRAFSTAPKTKTVEDLYAQGMALERGNGTTKDESKAAELYRRAAEQHYVPAQYNLALLYEEGRGVEQNLATAAKWYQAAADQGDAESQNNLGRLYALGHGLPQDALEAAYWYRKAAEQGNVEGQNNLANCYREGRGVRQDFATAFALYQKAAMAGYPAAQNNLGLMYANGTGTERDNCLAYAWLSLAARVLPTSQKLVQQIEIKMTSEEMSQAMRKRDELQATILSLADERTER